MLTICLFVVTLLLIFWLISLVWGQQAAKRIFKIAIYIGLLVAIIAGVYIGAQAYRWGFLLHQLNENSLNATEVINAASLPAAAQNTER